MNARAEADGESAACAASEAATLPPLLEAIVQTARELLRSTDVPQSIPRVLELIGRATNIERVHLLVVDPAGSLNAQHVVAHYLWTAPEFGAPHFAASDVGLSFSEVGLESWLPKLARGESIVGHARDFEDSARKFLESGGIRSVMAVPVFVDGCWWGLIAFDACQSERDWTPTETDTFKVLAELVGAAVARAQRVQSLADANHILDISPAVLFRLGPRAPFPLSFLSQNFRQYGYEAAEMLASPTLWRQLMQAEDAAAVLADINSLAAGDSDRKPLDFRFKLRDGSYIWFAGVAIAQRDEGGRLVAVEGVLTDISERKAIEQQLVVSNVLLMTTLESSPDAILVVDENARIRSFNKRFVELWNIPQELVDGGLDEPVLKLVASRVKNQEEFVALVRRLYASPSMESQDELETVDGRTIDRHSISLIGPAKQNLGRIWSFRDISQRKTVEQQMVQLARTDALTGLGNRTAFLERLQLAFARARRGGEDEGFAVHYLDLDHFKDVNDTLGHPAGDVLLRAVAERLRKCVRDVDLVSRFGGDEFAVLQEGVTDISGIEALATKIGESLSLPVTVGVNQVHVTASIGIVRYAPDIAAPEAMLTKADLALYRAKDKGRNQYRFHVAELDRQAQDRMTIGHDLHHAIERGELELFYQPQVDLRSERITGLEALIRWNHPVRGLLMPAVFIPIAESNGTIAGIGAWVIERACQQMRVWRDQRIAPAIMAVNVSAAQFQTEGELHKIVLAALKKHALAPTEFELELTESALMETTQRHQDVFQRLRDIGVRIAIDDFGTGFSSLAYLSSFRVARLKLAIEFVGDVTTNPQNAAIVRATAGLARDLGIDLIAEGVNTAEQRAFLLAVGCACGQGFGLGKPAAAERTGEVLRQNAAPRVAGRGRRLG